MIQVKQLNMDSDNEGEADDDVSRGFKINTGVEGGDQKFHKEERPVITDRQTDPDFVIERANKSIENLKIFRKKASIILNEAQVKFDKLHALVKNSMSTGTNMDGFLLGKFKEYQMLVDSEDLNLRLDLDIELW